MDLPPLYLLHPYMWNFGSLLGFSLRAFLLAEHYYYYYSTCLTCITSLFLDTMYLYTGTYIFTILTLWWMEATFSGDRTSLVRKGFFLGFYYFIASEAFLLAFFPSVLNPSLGLTGAPSPSLGITGVAYYKGWLGMLGHHGISINANDVGLNILRHPYNYIESNPELLQITYNQSTITNNKWVSWTRALERDIRKRWSSKGIHAEAKLMYVERILDLKLYWNSSRAHT